VQHDLEAYLDGDLPTVRTHQVEGHLSDCSACMAQVHLAKEIQNELRALPEMDAPAGVIQTVFAQTVRSEIPKRSLGDLLNRWPRPVWATLAAASLVLVFAVAVMNRGTTTPDHPDEAAIAQATAEARFALAQVGLATRKAGLVVRDKALQEQVVAPTLRSLSRALGPNPEQEPASLLKGVNDV
jgi:anti-sigma factor RsiW